ncbi:MAG: hypothetical protein ABEJ57_00260 [Halobacteriaceae archaeon]
MTAGDREDADFEMVEMGGENEADTASAPAGGDGAAVPGDGSEPPMDLVRAVDRLPTSPSPPALIGDVEPLEAGAEDLKAAIVQAVKEYFETVGVFTATADVTAEGHDPPHSRRSSRTGGSTSSTSRTVQSSSGTG